jgi:arylsulfatase A-like enzyme
MINKYRDPEMKQNIIFIMADDHGRQAISSYGSKTIETPNIDRLAEKGTRFTNAFANNSICAPSRASLLTGKYNHLCGVRRLQEVFDGAQQTFPKLLQQAGYQTAIIGKWHLVSQPTGFEHYDMMLGHGRFYDCPLNRIGTPWGESGEAGATVREGYLTDVITDESLAWLDQRDDEKPFCLMIHHKAPHSPHDPAPRHKDCFKDTIFPEPETLLDDYLGRAPEPVANDIAWSHLTQINEEGYKHLRAQLTGDRNHDTRLMYQEYIRNYLRLVLSLDENVGRVLDYVEENDLEDNTVIMYTSDNGFFNGEHGFYNKMWMYEDGFSIPLIIRKPGDSTAHTEERIVSMLDVAPTILDIAGVDIPDDIQGTSMKPILERRSCEWRDATYYHYYGVNRKPVAQNFIAFHEIIGVRTATEKMIFYPTWKNGPFWEFFDLDADPLEMNNLIDDPNSVDRIAKFKERLFSLAQEFEDDEALAYLA